MTETHSVWHTPRKVWHVSACLEVIPIFFLVQLLFPVHWPEAAMILVWPIALFLIGVDIIRMYYPKSNDFFLSLPAMGFFRKIWRPHEVSGYAASTYSVLAIAIIMSLLYSNLISEQVLIIAIMVMALCDPAASFTRFKLDACSPALKRFASFLAFVGICLLIMFIVGLFYRSINWDMLLAATIAGAFCEVYASKLWHVFVDIWKKSLGVPHWPLWLTSIYFDDNLTAPLSVALILMLFNF